MEWKTSRRLISMDRPLVMAILNVTPDSFSDGGEYLSVDDALKRAENMIDEGADIIDVGGESTRPGGNVLDAEQEIDRVIPVIAEISKRFETPISIDTTKSEVVEQAIQSGAEIINDISGLRFDVRIADAAARNNAGLILMHSRGTRETLHSEPPVDDIFLDIQTDLKRAVGVAHSYDVKDEQIALDVGIGFGKTLEQNLELIAKLDRLVDEFSEYPILVGASRKSFIGKVLGDLIVGKARRQHSGCVNSRKKRCKDRPRARCKGNSRSNKSRRETRVRDNEISTSVIGRIGPPFAVRLYGLL